MAQKGVQTAPLELLWDPLAPLWAPLGPPLGPPWVSLGPLGLTKWWLKLAVAPLWGSNAPSWHHLCLQGPFWVPFRLPKGPSGHHFGPPAVPNGARTFCLFVLGALFLMYQWCAFRLLLVMDTKAPSKATPRPTKRPLRTPTPQTPTRHPHAPPGPSTRPGGMRVSDEISKL